MTKIFISHSSNDTEFAKRLARALTEVGIDVWVDVANITAGTQWFDSMQEGLDNCEAMIIILSPNSAASSHVQYEWLYFLNKRKRIVAVRWKPTEVHALLKGIQYVDFYEKEFSVAFNHLFKELQLAGFQADAVQGQVHTIESIEAGGASYGKNVVPIITPTLVRDTVFISYSHEDAIWLERLQIALVPLKRAEPTIHTFVDREIKPGDKWKAEIEDALNRSKIGVLLLTPNFLASDFIMETELPILLKAYEAQEENILAIAVSSCNYEYTPLKEIQFMNNPDRPLDGLVNLLGIRH